MPDYRTRVYVALQKKVDGFTLTKEEFNKMKHLMDFIECDHTK